MLAVTWHRVYPGTSQRILAQRQYVEGLSKNKSPSCLLLQNFDGARWIVGVFWSMFVLSFTTRYVVVINSVLKVI